MMLSVGLHSDTEVGLPPRMLLVGLHSHIKVNLQPEDAIGRFTL